MFSRTNSKLKTMFSRKAKFDDIHVAMEEITGFGGRLKVAGLIAIHLKKCIDAHQAHWGVEQTKRLKGILNAPDMVESLSAFADIMTMREGDRNSSKKSGKAKSRKPSSNIIKFTKD